MVTQHYRVSSSELDATDALAVAHVGAHRFGHGVTVSSGVVSYRAESESDDLLDF